MHFMLSTHLLPVRSCDPSFQRHSSLNLNKQVLISTGTGQQNSAEQCWIVSHVSACADCSLQAGVRASLTVA